MSSFDDADDRAKYAVIPKSFTSNQVVKLEPKKLETKKETRTVLPEDKYLANLEKIIVRDYFPELPKLQAQSSYLDAVENNDIARMRELQLRFKTTRRTERRTSPGRARFANTPGGSSIAASPAIFDPDTPGPSRFGHAEDEEKTIPHANAEGDNEEKKKNALDDLTVDGYLGKFTSEDNASFEELSALMHQRNIAKIKWMYDAADKHNKELVKRGTALAANADEQLAIRYEPEAVKNRPKDLDNWSYTAHNHVLYYPEEKELTEEERLQRAKMNQRVINKAATRFPSDLRNKPNENAMARAAVSHAAAMAGKVDALGNEIGVVSAAALGLVSTPAIVPGAQDTPLMTWGEIDGTPFRLDAADVEAPNSSTPAFKIPALPAREQLAQTISDTIAKRYREKRKVAMEQAERAHKTPRFGSARTSDALMSLSPAARLLMKNKLGIRTPGRDSPLTPSPAVKKWTKSPMVSIHGSSSRVPSSPSITDNLLNVSFPSPIRKKKPEGGQKMPVPDSPDQEKTKDEAAKRPNAGDFF